MQNVKGFWHSIHSNPKWPRFKLCCLKWMIYETVGQYNNALSVPPSHGRLFSCSILTPQCRKGPLHEDFLTWMQFCSTPHTIGSSMPVRQRPTWLAALSFCIFESLPTHAHTHPVFYCLALWCCYPLCLRRGKTLSCLKQNVCIYGKCTTSDISERNSQAWVYWPIQYSTTWIYLLQNQTDHALLHICLCIHMQRIELHVCMSMRPMVLSMICLIYGLDTLVNH